MLHRPVDGDRAGDLAPRGDRFAVPLGRAHQPAAVLVARQQPVHALEVEPEVRLRARFGQRGLLGVAGGPEPPAVQDRREPRDEGHADEPKPGHAVEVRGGDAGHRTGTGDEDRVVAHALVLGLRRLELLVALLDAVDDRRVLGRRADRFGLELQPVVGGEDPLGCGPQHGLVDGGQLVHELVAPAARREVGRGQAHAAAGLAHLEAGPAEEVDLAVGRHVLAAHIRRGVDVDHPVAGADGPEHGEVAAVVLDDLEVDAGPAAAERADELTDQALALELAHARDDREAWVEVEREGVGSGLDHQALEVHTSSSAGLRRHLRGTCRGMAPLGGPRRRVRAPGALAAAR
jgi:hypothetical protein